MVVTFLKRLYRKYKNDAYQKQGMVTKNYYGTQLQFPAQHLLLNITDENAPQYEALRENGLVKLVKSISKIKKKGLIIDIGANVGDSAAIMGALSDNPIICVEASNYFFDILEKNIKNSSFGSRTELFCGYVVESNEYVPKKLHHWGGTAYETDEAEGNSETKKITIDQLVNRNEDVALIKTDIDGNDIRILGLGLPSIAGKNIPAYFELQVPLKNSESFLKESFQLFKDFIKNEYAYFYFWDNTGHFLNFINAGAHANGIETIESLLNYLYLNEKFRPKLVCNYDIVCIHRKDRLLAETLLEEINADLPFPFSFETRSLSGATARD